MKKSEKKELKKFSEKAKKWACSIDSFGDNELEEVEKYLLSDEFFNEVELLLEKCKNQKQFNEEVTEVVSNKFSELLLEVEHNTSLENFLKNQGIKTLEDE